MKLSRLLIATGLFLTLAARAYAAPVYWTDWSSVSSGVLTAGSSSVNVSLTGTVDSYDNGSPFYYQFPATFGNLAPSDLIRVAGTGSFTLTFDNPLTDIYLALVSVGQPSLPVTYSFDTPFSVFSEGPGGWGGGTYSISGNDFTGSEFNGVLLFSGSHTSLTFNINQPEYWHGFNIGVAQILAPDVQAEIPEPGSLALVLAGIGLLGFSARRRMH